MDIGSHIANVQRPGYSTDGGAKAGYEQLTEPDGIRLPFGALNARAPLRFNLIVPAHPQSTAKVVSCGVHAQPNCSALVEHLRSFVWLETPVMASVLILLTCSLLVFQVTGYCGPLTSFETAPCSVFSREPGYELREYPGGQLVELSIENSTFEAATFAGFFRLASYLNGDNRHDVQVPIVLPFMVQPASSVDGYRVGLYLPRSVGDAPSPRDRSMRIREAHRSIQAVIGPFPAFAINETNYLHNTRQLMRFLQRDGLRYNPSSVIYAAYINPADLLTIHQEVHLQVLFD
ncbi:uncharacterized protein LOC9659359 isoform X1 [Selaginella moellendorffii]|uniref:uncharacterized protein LOC9659359 isoform X1 n=1 Tax=Selaginella moellendorffii TaxID=88036 RepID=UPI000D1CC76A|nr:uncharacterized protein LOC9659359 isoform X1 [Selaginella moellendorffii]|eukprot:XP_002964949.2 uncharacterized protein LOC9659359 isoform X1 [Selaginella moellendorffii]